MKKRMKIKVLSAVVCMLLLAGGFQAVEGNAREAGSAEATETAVETTSDQTARETEESAGTAVNLQGSLMMLTESAEAKEAPEEMLGLGAPGFDLAGIRHETLYSRLYMS